MSDPCKNQSEYINHFVPELCLSIFYLAIESMSLTCKTFNVRFNLHLWTVKCFFVGFNRYGHTDTDMVIPIYVQQTDTPLQNLYQTDTDICFEIPFQPIPIIGI